jgi:hypothetical protein
MSINPSDKSTVLEEEEYQ